MILKAIIVDDEQKSIDALEILIKQYISGVKLVAQSVEAWEAVLLIDRYKPELVFLDADLPELNGFEMLGKLRWRNFSPVYVTNPEESTLSVLKNNALDYLLKPFDQGQLQLIVDRTRDKMENKNVGNSWYRFMSEGRSPFKPL